MDTSKHNLYTLFDQLGLPNDEASIERFARHYRLSDGQSPLSGGVLDTSTGELPAGCLSSRCGMVRRVGPAQRIDALNITITTRFGTAVTRLNVGRFPPPFVGTQRNRSTDIVVQTCPVLSLQANDFYSEITLVQCDLVH